MCLTNAHILSYITQGQSNLCIPRIIVPITVLRILAAVSVHTSVKYVNQTPFHSKSGCILFTIVSRWIICQPDPLSIRNLTTVWSQQYPNCPSGSITSIHLCRRIHGLKNTHSPGRHEGLLPGLADAPIPHYTLHNTSCNP